MKFKADFMSVSEAKGVLEKQQGLEHLEVRNRGDLLILESKSRDGKERYPHVRFRRVSVHYWTIEMPTKNKWEPVFIFEKRLLKDNIQLTIFLGR